MSNKDVFQIKVLQLLSELNSENRSTIEGDAIANELKATVAAYKNQTIDPMKMAANLTH